MATLKRTGKRAGYGKRRYSIRCGGDYIGEGHVGRSSDGRWYADGGGRGCGGHLHESGFDTASEAHAALQDYAEGCKCGR